MDETQLNAIQKFLENRVTLIQVKWTHLYACYSTIYWKACFFFKKKSNHFTITCYAVITSNYGIKILFVPLNIHIIEEQYKRDGDPSLHIVPQEQINTERRGRVEDVGCWIVILMFQWSPAYTPCVNFRFLWFIKWPYPFL